jgi:hypothetical protein
MIGVICISQARSQRTVFFEAGASYFSNDVKYAQTQLYDFFAFTINTRVFLSAKERSAVSLDFPFSVRTRFNQDIMTRFGLHLPVLLTYNTGAGSSTFPSDKKIGGLVGIGLGYFHQEGRARFDEVLKYDDSFSAFGPQAQIGMRIPVRSITLFHSRNRPVSPLIALKASYLVDTRSSDNNMGTLSLLIGLQF